MLCNFFPDQMFLQKTKILGTTAQEVEDKMNQITLDDERKLFQIFQYNHTFVEKVKNNPDLQEAIFALTNMATAVTL